MFLRSLIPGTSGGLYALIPAASGMYTVLSMFVYSGVTGKPMSAETGVIKSHVEQLLYEFSLSPEEAQR